MKKFLLVVTLVLFIATQAIAGYVNGYTRSDGTYVSGHYRSDSDSSYNNNYSTKGNVNPYTGQSGTKSRTFNDRTPNYNKKTYGNPGYLNNNQFKLDTSKY